MTGKFNSLVNLLPKQFIDWTIEYSGLDNYTATTQE